MRWTWGGLGHQSGRRWGACWPARLRRSAGSTVGVALQDRSAHAHHVACHQRAFPGRVRLDREPLAILCVQRRPEIASRRPRRKGARLWFNAETRPKPRGGLLLPEAGAVRYSPKVGLGLERRAWSAACLLGQLSPAPGFELPALSPCAVDLADRIPAGQCDDGRDEREYQCADCDDDLQHDDDGDDSRDHDKSCSHPTDYRAPPRPVAGICLPARQSSSRSFARELARSAPSVTCTRESWVRRSCCPAEGWSRTQITARLGELAPSPVSPRVTASTALALSARAGDPDEHGNLRLTGETADGRPILVVVASDTPDFVVQLGALGHGDRSLWWGGNLAQSPGERGRRGDRECPARER